ncbi:MAG: serine hydrolase domain-containing protein [Vicinamibacterales bacterium]
MRILRLAAVVLVLVGAPGVLWGQAAASGAQAGAQRFERVRALARAALASTGAPGLSVAIGGEGVVQWAEGFGLADVEQQVPVTPDTVFRIASISKPITATAVMQLVERGRVSLDDPIRKWVPAFPAKGEQTITIRHLLTHTSGIRHYKDGEFNQVSAFGSVDEAIAIFKDDPLLFAPGTRYSYSTYGYNLLAGVVERASGLTFEAYVRDRVWAPAGMTRTALEHPQDIVMRRARQYVRGPAPAGVRNAPYTDLSIKWAGGGVISTASDLVRFELALESGALVKPGTLEQMRTAATLADGSRTGYGLGWMVQTGADGRRSFAHSGGATGGTTYLLRDGATGLTVAVLANVEDAPGLGDLARALAAAGR